MSRPTTAPTTPDGKAKGKKKKKAEEPPPPPPPPPPIALQVRSIAWRCMDFRVQVPPTANLSELKALIMKRHAKASGKDAITRMDFYFDDVAPEKLLPPDTVMGSVGFSRKGDTGMFELFYDYYPHADPFENRPFAARLSATNPEVLLPPPPPVAPPAAS
ncbi:hypothetical protein AB1Y20_016441 [Prymnesium parvum]|uniref:Ubiquitin-like domain-containing protein n=1 Tax=Prymnesium parvum TaxID=97485 RepID=A0AB34IE12_PRYPA